MAAYYNEFDPFAAAWLRELITDGLIAPGDVDERSIVDVRPADIGGYEQCHFFAGIGIWSLALREAGWPDERPIWTGSCPCQPFSAAGKGGGLADERHLWPALDWLIAQCRPPIVVGEQVSSDDGLAWLDVVLANLDEAGYACGALDTCAAGFGAPHIRQRLYWVAHAGSAERRQGQPRFAGAESGWPRAESSGCGEYGGMADAGCGIVRGERFALAGTPRGSEGEGHQRQRLRHDARDGRDTNRPGPANGLWRAADWLGCRDGKWRPVMPGSFPLAATGTVRNRVGMLRGAGNAINVAQAKGFLEAVIDCCRT